MVAFMLSNVQMISVNSSQTNIYSVVDKKKKYYTLGPGSSTQPYCRHDYEDIYDVLPQKPPPPYQHSDSRPNSRVPLKVPASYQSRFGNKEMSSPRRIGKLHSNSVDILLSNTGYVVCSN